MPAATGSDRPEAYLFVLSHIEGLRWVFATSQAGFTRRWREVLDLRPGDALFLYCGRQMFEDRRARICGEVIVTSPVEPVALPIRVGSVSIKLVCDIDPVWLAPASGGAQLREIVGQLQAFSQPGSYPILLRRPLVRLSDADAALIRRVTAAEAVEQRLALDSYEGRS